jgi:PEP-CTERM motif-containing protein
VSVDRSANGGVVGFNYAGAANLTGTESTQLLVIQTNAMAYMPGLLSVQDSLAANGVGFQPTPEPISMSLLGGGLALIGFGRWRRNQKKS